MPVSVNSLSTTTWCLCFHVEAKVGVNGPLRTIPTKATTAGEVPGCVCLRCTLERVLTDVGASKCVHICMFYSMFVWEAMRIVYISSTLLFIWQQQIYHGLFCENHEDVYHVWIYTSSCVTCGEFLKIIVLLLEEHGDFAWSTNVAIIMYISHITFITVYIIYKKPNNFSEQKRSELW